MINHLDYKRIISKLFCWMILKQSSHFYTINFYLVKIAIMSRDIVPTARDPFWKDPFFSSTWDEFDKMRQDMMNQSKSFWSGVDKDFTNFDEMVKKSHSEMDRQMMPAMPQLPRWAVPDDLRDKMSPMLSAPGGGADEVIKVDDADGKFEVTLDVSQFKPEELKVTTVNDILSVEGCHAEKSDNSGASSSVMRQFSRKWTLPKGCKADDVVSNLSSDGILMVTAPKNPALTGENTKAIQ